MAYGVLVVSALLFEFAANLAFGTMPLALHAGGASDASVAVAMGCGMFASVLTALPLGSVADRYGRLMTMRVSALAGGAALAGLALTTGPVAAGALLAVRSIAIVGFMGAEFAYASSLASKERAVSGVATLGMIGNLTLAIAPAFGVALWQHGVGREQLWYACLASAAAFAVTFFLPNEHDVRSRNVRRVPLMHPRWLPAVAYAGAATLQGGVNGALAIITFQGRGIVNGAAILSASALTTFALRYPAGRLVDRYGPRALVLPIALIQGAGCVLAAFAFNLPMVIMAGLFLGTAWGAVVPVALGLLFEHGTVRTRGAAMGAYNLALGGGAAAGAIVATLSTLAGGGYTAAIGICAIAPFVALPYVLRSTPGRHAIVRGLRPTTSS